MAIKHSGYLQVWERPDWSGNAWVASFYLQVLQVSPRWLVGLLPSLCLRICLSSCSHPFVHPTHVSPVFYCILAPCWHLVVCPLCGFLYLNFPDCWCLQDILEPMGCSVMSLLIAFLVSALISPFLPSYVYDLQVSMVFSSEYWKDCMNWFFWVINFSP